MRRQPGKNVWVNTRKLFQAFKIALNAQQNSQCFSFTQMCLNGKCVYEHENEVDYDGFGFLRRSGKITDDKLIETPSEKR